MAGCASEPEEIQDPASDVREVLSESGAYRVSYTPLPDPIPPVDLFAMEFRVVDASTGLWHEDIEIVGLEVSMPEHNHGMNVEPPTVTLRIFDAVKCHPPMLTLVAWTASDTVDRSKSYAAEHNSKS